MNSLLLENNYLHIPNFISISESKKLAEEYKKYCKDNNETGDAQVPKSEATFNYISFLEILCEKTPLVSSLLQEKVLPTYVYSRIYKNNSILEKHTDRDACEISLTVHLDGDKEWPIYIKTPSGEDRCLILQPGDAMMYLGCEAEHWRNSYPGEWYCQIFLHYVKSRGKRSYAYFDKLKEPTVETKKETIIIDETPKSPTLIVPNKPKIPNLEDHIKVYESILSDELCDMILEEYKNSNLWQKTSVGNIGVVNDNVRSCQEIPISMPPIINENVEKRSLIDKQLFVSANNAIKKYTQDFPNCKIEQDSGYELLRYNADEFYIQHVDSFREIPREVSCSFSLNDDYEGGEFAFFDREIMMRLSKGSALLFPSNFMYPHEIMPVKDGTRYSIVTWFI